MGTLNIQNGSIKAQKFIGSVTGKCTTSVGGWDYTIRAIACCLAPTIDIGYPGSWSSGRLVLPRENGLNIPPVIEYTMSNCYGQTNRIHACYRTSGYDFQILYPAVFTYQGVRYGGFIYKIGDASDYSFSVDTTGNFEPFHCGIIYTTNDNQIRDPEIWNSIDTSLVQVNQVFNLHDSWINACKGIVFSQSYGSALPAGAVEGQIYFKLT